MKDVAVYIGRFNPFHLGHAYILKEALENYKLTIVLIGSSGLSRSIKNPFTYNERESMISCFASHSDLHHKLIILPLNDYPYNDNYWIQEVQKKVKKGITEFCIRENIILSDITLIGANKDKSTSYLNYFSDWNLSLKSGYKNISGTNIRNTIFNDKSVLDKVPVSSANFITEFIKTFEFELLQQEYEYISNYKNAWNSAPYPPVFVTTDVVLIQANHVLVITREKLPGKGLWALPGGFIDQNERLQDCAIRELMEETGILFHDEVNTQKKLLNSIKGKEIFDNPNRSLRGRVISTAFLIELHEEFFPEVKGMNVPGTDEVETSNVKWIPIQEALSRTNMWFEDHYAILSWFMI